MASTKVVGATNHRLLQLWGWTCHNLMHYSRPFKSGTEHLRMEPSKGGHPSWVYEGISGHRTRIGPTLGLVATSEELARVS